MPDRLYYHNNVRGICRFIASVRFEIEAGFEVIIYRLVNSVQYFIILMPEKSRWINKN